MKAKENSIKAIDISHLKNSFHIIKKTKKKTHSTKLTYTDAIASIKIKGKRKKKLCITKKRMKANSWYTRTKQTSHVS